MPRQMAMAMARTAVVAMILSSRLVRKSDNGSRRQRHLRCQWTYRHRHRHQCSAPTQVDRGRSFRQDRDGASWACTRRSDE